MENDSVPVKVIRKKGRAALVSYVDFEGVPRRVSVSVDHLEERDGEYLVEETMLDAGIPQGPYMDELLDMSFEISGKDILIALRNAGVWTLQDFQNPLVVKGIILEVCKPILVQINTLVRNYRRRE